MVIRSEIGIGKIYAGDTPLECYFEYEQTGPLEITVSPGHLKTTGQAKIVPIESALEAIDKGDAEDLGDGRARVWFKDIQGRKLKPEIISNSRPVIIEFAPDPHEATAHSVSVGRLNGELQIRYWRRLLEEEYDEAGWQYIQSLIFEFVLSPEATELPDIYVFTVESGFPPDYEGGMQMGRTTVTSDMSLGAERSLI